MPADALKMLSPGDDSLSSATWNTFVNVARQVQGTAGGGGQFGNPLQATVIFVRNDSGADQDRFNVLGLEGPVIGPGDNLLSFLARVCLSGVTPVAALHRARFCVLQEPVPAGMIGRAAVAGVSYARVRGDLLAGCADVVDGDADALAFAAGGGAQVLAVCGPVADPASGSGSGSGSGTGTGSGPDPDGDQWAVIRFGNACVLPAGAEHGSGSGSGTGSGEGGPGFPCTHCTGPTPLTWATTLSGFTGELAVFNGTWTLAQAADACSWSHADATRTVWLDKLASGFRLRLYTTDGDFEIQYTGGNDDCCADQVLGTYSVITGSPTGGHAAGVSLHPACGEIPCPDPCGHCDNGVAPLTWGWAVGAADFADLGTGGAGACTWSQLNNTSPVLVKRAGACTWAPAPVPSFHGHTIQLDYRVGLGPVLEIVNQAGACTVDYARDPAIPYTAPWDCCAPLVLVRFGTPVPGTPATIVLTPSGGCCPPGGGGGGGLVSEPCCPDGLPALLHATMVSADCPCMGTQTVPLLWDGSARVSAPTAFGTCGSTITLTLTCDRTACPFNPGVTMGYNLHVHITGPGGAGTSDEDHCDGLPTNSTCSPLALHFNWTGVGAHCPGVGGGQIVITVTE